MNNTAVKPRLSFKAQTISAIIAIISAVVLPQIFHVMGAVSGLGTALGETFLPMHLPIILVGLIAGSYAGAASGIIAPLISFAFTGMPGAVMLPFMMIELCVYGLTAGILRNAKIPTITKVFIAQATGRAVRAIAILGAVYMLEISAPPVSIIWTSISVGIFGIALQWALIPLIVYRVENGKRYDG